MPTELLPYPRSNNIQIKYIQSSPGVVQRNACDYVTQVYKLDMILFTKFHPITWRVGARDSIVPEESTTFSPLPRKGAKDRIRVQMFPSMSTVRSCQIPLTLESVIRNTV
jgi:hypothetical protein